ncbi:DUF3883 domain-containing protein [Actinoplanes bogorensis]|uniref:DUF3883 domain-containing protein n=1 Tax=Paractinoplanes bogorensis TaxID=1610840 RepID=A0ABS5Z1G5_9ACTN|nr:DUF3883 domain-containing protein [Actinoplanes bogorensis]MBU2669522.1 DUF3883 domain-containing protein [Actinoplanes bogorensis]
MAVRNPAWTREEIILACELVADNGWKELRTPDPKVQQLSKVLRSMSIHPVENQLPSFRSPDSVSRKTSDLMTAHPSYQGKPTRGSKLDREVIDAFENEPQAMRATAARIRASLTANSPGRDRRSGVADGVHRHHIDAALKEWWMLGRDVFMDTYSTNAADRYVVVTPGGPVDALALIVGARAKAGLDTAGPWRGDRANVAGPLRSLGYLVDDSTGNVSPEVVSAEHSVDNAAGYLRGSTGGQGFLLDQKKKVAIELYAMKRALEHYAARGDVLNTSRHASWDYEVDIGNERWHVEVKGTTGDPIDVILTPNEVMHARSYPRVALFVVSNIDVRTGADDEFVTSGGKITHLHPWTIEDTALRPIGYKYRLPDSPP